MRKGTAKEHSPELQDIELEQEGLERLRDHRLRVELLKKDHEMLTQVLAQKEYQLSSQEQELTRLRDIKAEYQALQPLHERLLFELRRTKEHRDELQAKLEAICEPSLRAELKAVKSELVNCHGECKSLLIENQRLEGLMATLKAESKESLQNLDQQNKCLRIRIEGFKSELDRLRFQNSTLRDQAKAAESMAELKAEQLAEVLGEHAGLAQGIEAAKKTIEQREELLLGLKRELDRVKNEQAKEKAVLQMEFQKKGLLISGQNSQLSQQRVRLQQLQQLFQQANRQNLDLQKQMSHLIAANKSLENRLEHETRRGKELASKLGEAKGLIERQDSELRGLQLQRSEQKRVKTGLQQLRHQARQLKKLQMQRIDELVGSIQIRRGKR